MYTEPLLAWRRWSITDEHELRSFFKEIVWPPGERLDARCVPRRGEIHSTRRACEHAPNEGCNCGVYGVRTRAEVDQWGDPARMRRAAQRLGVTFPKIGVVGRVSLWGKVIVCDRGWRAQYAYPYELYVHTSWPSEVAETAVRAVAYDLRKLYMVDVTALN